jgi:hypothetical protein
VGARVKEGDLRGVADDALALPDELMQPWGFAQSAALLVDIEPVVCTWRLSIDEHAEANVSSTGSGRHHEMQIACVDVVDDLAFMRRRSSVSSASRKPT